MRRANCVGGSLILSFCLAGAASAQWGDLTAKFVLDGKAPAAKKIAVTKDQEFCGPFNLVDESVVVNADNGGIANVIVYLRDTSPPKVHPDYAASAKEPTVLDNKGCRFEPHVALIRTSQPLLLKNSDQVGHNSNYVTRNNPPQNVLIPAGGEVSQKLTQEETLPAPVSCSIHPWMKGFLVVKAHPYMAVSDKDGNLVIKNLPVGKHTFQAWQEASGYLSDVKIGGKDPKWARGRFEIEIKAGANDLGEVKVAAGAFKQ